MEWKLAILMVVLLAVEETQADNSFIFIASKIVRPGLDLAIRGSLLRRPSGDVTVTAELLRGSDVVTQTSTVFRDKQEQTLYLEVPRDLKKATYTLKVSGRGRLSFTEKATLQYEEKGSSIFIQTDKAIYKPGQTIRYRIFGVTPDLKTVFDKLRVIIKDAKKNRIRQIDVSNSELTSLGGVYEGQLAMSDHPVLGDWTIRARFLQLGSSAEKSFTIDEYVLPKFETDLKLPSFGRTADSEFRGSVTAKYTHGNPVKGKVKLRIRPKKETSSKKIELSFPIDGKAEFRVQTSKLKTLVGSLNLASLVFEANTTEGVTGLTESTEQELRFYDKPIKVEFPKSLPTTFQPGMTYTAVVRVAQQDDLPPETVSGKMRITVTHYFKTRRPTFRSRSRWSWRRWRPPPPPPPVERSEKQPTESVTVPADGIVEHVLDIPSRVVRATIEAEYDGITARHTIKKRHSPSNSYIQIRLLTLKPKAGDTAEFEVKSTENVENVSFQLFSKGRLLESGNDLNIRRSATLPLVISASMAPKARIVIYYVRRDGEVVADALAFNVESSYENKVAIGFSENEVTPNQAIQFSVKADPGSKVNVLAVDQSVLLLKSGNDITSDEVRTELESYATPDVRTGSTGGGRCGWFCYHWPVPTDGEDVKDVFDRSSVVVLTDATVYEHKEPPPPPIWRPRPMPRPWFLGENRRFRMARRRNFAMMAMDGGVGGARAAPRLEMAAAPQAMPALALDKAASMDVPVPTLDELQPVSRTRKIFPEAWLWESGTISTGNFTVDATVPDTITSWVATAFAVNANSGLGLPSAAAMVTTKLPFFAQVVMPYSVVRGEKVIIKVIVFNYHTEPLFTWVTLMRSTQFDNIHVSTTGGISAFSTTSSDVRRTVMIQPGEVRATYFPISPKELGLIPLNIRAQSTQFADSLEKNLLVEPEGAEREFNVPHLIDLAKPSSNFNAVTDIAFPKSTVPGSGRITVTAIGDLMGPSANNLDKLLKMPYGCGEQNMLNFAPNIFIVKYMEAIKNVDSAIMDKAKNYMEKGYQRELTYQHGDGSFSAFGDRDPSGSMWLSAFVLKSFVQAMPYIFVDEDVLHRTVDWIIKKQNSDGSFPEPGKVLHKAMQGGSAGEDSLTAYVLIALLEAESVDGIKNKISNAKGKALAFLEQDVTTKTDLYELSILSYTLALASSSQALTVWNKLDSLATVEDGQKYWAVPEKTPVGPIKPWERRKGKGKALNIEITAYALLSLATRNDKIAGLQVIKWLTGQRNSNGGYSSTQDTIVALQALAEMAKTLYSGDIDMTITLSGTDVTGSFTITSQNSLVLQSVELPDTARQITVSGSGHGIALVDIGVNYNIFSDDQNQAFQFTVTVTRETRNDFDVRACASWLLDGASTMALIEIGTPSAFFADTKNGVQGNPKRVEEGNRKVIMYFDEIGKTDTCVTVTMYRFGLVTGVQPVPARVVDYYEPSNQVTEMYVPNFITDTDVCKICEKECDFCSSS